MTALQLTTVVREFRAIAWRPNECTPADYRRLLSMTLAETPA